MGTSVYDVVVVGGSIAGVRSAEAVSRRDPSLRVVIVGDEPHAPYERPPLSKVALHQPVDLESLTYPSVAALDAQGVEFRLGCRATALDIETSVLHVDDGSIGYRTLIAATGCEPVVPPIFAGLPDVHTLRRYEDARALRAALADPSRTVAIIGAGFIGGEVASMLAAAHRAVTIVDVAARPVGRFGGQVADAYAALHRSAGVELHFGAAVVAVSDSGLHRHLVLDDATSVPADLIVVGAGVRPSTDWLDGSGVVLDNGVVCDSALRAGRDVFAAGDTVRWVNPRYGTAMRTEHWTNAVEHGRVAGNNAVNLLRGDALEECATVPYFWSDQHGIRIQFAGFLYGDEEILEYRHPDGGLFLYRRDDVVGGVLAFQRRAEFARLRAALRQGLAWDAAQDMVTTDPLARLH